MKKMIAVCMILLAISFLAFAGEKVVAPAAPSTGARGAQALAPITPEQANVYAAKQAFLRLQESGTASPADKALIEQYLWNSAPSGGNSLDNQGGPDAFGYQWLDNQGSDTATYAWIELYGDPNATPFATWGSYDDGCASTYGTIGFNFPLYGVNYTTFTPTSNGQIEFGTCYAYAYTNCMPYASWGPAILPYMYDLHLQRGGHATGSDVVWYRNFGNYTVIEYDSVGYYSCTGASLKFEVILYSNGNIKIQYNNIANIGTCYMGTVGIQNAAATTYLQYRCYNSGNTVNPLVNGRAIWFYLPGVAPTGRCCYGDICNPSCVVNRSTECTALGGTFTVNSTCASPCPVPIPGDLCCNAIPINSFPYLITGQSTAGFGNDYAPSCMGSYGTGRDVVYTFTLGSPNTLHFDLTNTGTYAYAGLGVFLGCPNSGTCIAYATNYNGDVHIPCTLLQPGTYYILVDNWPSPDYFPYDLGVSGCVCEITCPTYGIQEGEPVCYDGYVDNYNGGCNSTPYVFQPIQCGQTICGTSGTFIGPDGVSQYRDTDWFELDLATPTTITWVAYGNFPMQTFVIGAPCPGTILGQATAAICSLATINYNALPGSYYLWVGPQVFTGIPCGAPYVATVTCTPWIPPTGRCCYGQDPQNPLCETDRVDQCTVLGGTWTQGIDCSTPCPIPFLCHCTEDMPGRYCNMVGGPINDVSHNYFTVNVPIQYHITDLNACINLTHTFDGDLYITLTSPNGTVIVLSNRNGGGGDNYHCTTFDDEASTPIASGTPPYEGSFIPSTPLSAVDGQNAAGVWTLDCQDMAGGDVGTLIWFCLTFQWDYILAVELNSFTAVPGDNSVAFNWSTASESNSHHFEMVRDGQTLASVPATNSPTGGHYSWTDNTAINGTVYHYSLVAVDVNGSRREVGTLTSSPSFNAATITEYALHQNYPNPFNPTTSIAIDLVEKGNVSLKVYNLMGQEVANLVSGTMERGRHIVNFNAASMSSGVYLYRLNVNGFTAEKKMLLMK